jgi:ketosteroid isomerase-like protein
MATGQSDAESVIRRMTEEYVRHFNAGDADQLTSSFYTEDAHLLPPNHPMVTGQSQIRDTIRALLESGLGGLAIRPARITSSGDFAYVIGAFSLERPTPDTGKYLEVHRRQADGSWRCVADMFSSDLPAS